MQRVSLEAVHAVGIFGCTNAGRSDDLLVIEEDEVAYLDVAAVRIHPHGRLAAQQTARCLQMPATRFCMNVVALLRVRVRPPSLRCSSRRPHTSRGRPATIILTVLYKVLLQ